MKTFLILFALTLSFSPLYAEFEPNADKVYIKAKAKKGDGIYAILNRYHLQIASCNYQKFLELNNISAKSKIYRDREYSVPILKIAYDGKSITSSINTDDQALADEIETYNAKMLNRRLKLEDFIEDKSIWVPHHMILCEKTTVQKNNTKRIEKKVTKVEPLFGKEKSIYEIKNTSLKGEVYYVVSGHGGPDPGAIHNAGSPSCLCEDEYAYDVSLRLAKNLMEHGATVHMIIQDKNDGLRDGLILPCDRDEKCLNEGTIPLNQLRRLKQRVKSVNDLYQKHKKAGVKKQKLVVVHVDSRPKGQRQDVFFLYSKGSKNGKKMAANLLDTFAEKYKKNRKDGNYDGEIVARNLYVLRNTHPAAVYVELANIKNPTDQKRITKVGNRQALADWLYEGLIK